jgi:hypothetical protein
LQDVVLGDIKSALYKTIELMAGGMPTAAAFAAVQKEMVAQA